MVICKQCGAPMGDNALSCGKCGAGVENAPELIKQGLIKDLERFKKLLGDASELSPQIRPQSDFPSAPASGLKKRTLMKYLWPYLVAGIGAATVLYIIIVVMTLQSAVSSGYYNSSRYSRADLESSLAGGVYGGYILAALVGVAIIGIGIFIAKKKRASFNNNVDYMIREVNEKYNQGVKNLQMREQLNKKLREMQKYESLVPEEYQRCDKLGEIIDLLKSDKAQTVEEAIAQLG